MAVVAASTGWNVERCGSLAAAAEELMGLGFAGVELRAPKGAPDAATCGGRLRDRKVRVLSAHAPLLPTAAASAALDRLADGDDAARARAVEALVASARNAMAAGTGTVVVHAGEVSVGGARERFRRWRDVADAAGVIPPAVLEEAAALRAERAALRDGALEAVVRSLHAACRAVPDATFALETRLHLHEIPSLEEVEILFSEVGARNLAYAHDTGHAAVQEALGGPPAAAWLERYGPRCVDAHLHDVLLLRDHLPPGAGRLRWGEILPELPSACPRVLEVRADVPPAMMRESMAVIS